MSLYIEYFDYNEQDNSFEFLISWPEHDNNNNDKQKKNHTSKNCVRCSENLGPNAASPI